MLTAGLGAAHAILFILALILLTDAPGPTATDAELIEYYGSEGSRRVSLAGLYVMPFAGIAFIWFIVALRLWISGSDRREDALLSSVQLVSGILYTGLFLVSAAASAAIAAATEFTDADIDPTFARHFNQYGDTILFVFAMRMAAIFVFTTSTMARHAKILPTWFLVVGYAVGLFLLLSACFYRWLTLVFPVWLLCLTVLLMWRARAIPRGRKLVMQPGPAVIVDTIVTQAERAGGGGPSRREGGARAR